MSSFIKKAAFAAAAATAFAGQADALDLTGIRISELVVLSDIGYFQALPNFVGPGFDTYGQFKVAVADTGITITANDEILENTTTGAFAGFDVGFYGLNKPLPHLYEAPGTNVVISPTAFRTTSEFAIVNLENVTFGDQGKLVLDFAQPVPEPMTWTMMIAGFGLVGGALRSKRPTQVNNTAPVVSPSV